ncbi:Rubber elongation factor protein (REF) [Quillaja saponaria]|uniref:Rubber elongation factor protein (REF) n=1 Tax=Quillaja saponaria TaxID=32244 RepID=A0AAD7LG40_QUISA|nr:Rubber elongation factor protein (REF) [Quillaja saponaria]
MADNQIETENKNQELKHLGFVRIVAIQALVCVSNIYEYAKQNCGPLRSTVGTVEGTVTTVLYPVYEKLKDFPDDLLVFIDHKIDEAINKFDEHAPPFAKQAVYQAQGLIQKLTLKTVKVVNEAQTGGPLAEKAVPTAAHWSEKYNNVIKDLTRKGYAVFGYLPLVPVEEIAKASKQGEAGKKGTAAVSTGHKSDSDSNSDSD